MRPGINLTRVRLISFLAIALASVAGLAACGGGSGGGSVVVTPPPPPPTGTGITVFPGVATVPLAGKAVFTAFVPSAPTTTTFTWAVTGGSANGTITTDASGKGDYVAPAAVPAGAVTVTVTSGSSLGGSATVTITALPAGGIAVSPASISVAAGTTFQFGATANGATTTVTSWQVNGTAGGDTLHGTIDANGNYTAPAMPPPGGSTTITAITATGSASATATVVFSNNSFTGPYTFSYSGDDGTSFLAVAGSFTATTGTLVGGEDATDAQATASAAITGVYAIGPDGRGTVTIAGGPNGGETWQIALTGNPAGVAGNPVQHVLLVRFDTTGTGSGTIDQQNTIEAASPFPVGNYVFGLSGIDGAAFSDHGGFSLATAGKFFSNGASTGNAAVWDVNDGGTSVTDDTTLTATFTPASNGFTGSVGRGILTLFSTNSTLDTLAGQATTSTFQFVFYVVDNTHVKIVENDGHAFLSGDIFSGPTTNDGAFTQSGVLKNGNYAFTVGGASTNGSYAAGGVFGVNAGAGTSAGVIDVNNGGVQIPLDKTLSTSYTVDTNLGRIAFTLTPTGGSAYSFAGYTTSKGTVEMVETDALSIVASGLAYPQAATGEPAGTFAANISGIATKAQQEEDAGGQIVIAGTTVTGTLDLNNVAVSGNVDPGLSLISGTTIVATDSNGRGTLSLQTSVVTYPLVYYVVDSKTALVLGTSATHVVLGMAAAQF